MRCEVIRAVRRHHLIYRGDDVLLAITDGPHGCRALDSPDSVRQYHWALPYAGSVPLLYCNGRAGYVTRPTGPLGQTIRDRAEADLSLRRLKIDAAATFDAARTCTLLRHVSLKS